jgi:hypothetical protein
MRAPIRFTDATLAPPRAAPTLGMDNDRVTGFSDKK